MFCYGNISNWGCKNWSETFGSLFAASELVAIFFPLAIDARLDADSDVGSLVSSETKVQIGPGPGGFLSLQKRT